MCPKLYGHIPELVLLQTGTPDSLFHGGVGALFMFLCKILIALVALPVMVLMWGVKEKPNVSSIPR